MFKCIAVLALVAAVALATKGVPTVTNCSPSNAIFTNLKYTWSPNDIEPGDKVTISFSGDLQQTASQLNLQLVASFDGLPIINQQMNICPLLKNPSCPIPAGPLSHDVVFTIPNLPISGVIGATATLTDQTGAELVCINLSMNI